MKSPQSHTRAPSIGPDGFYGSSDWENMWWQPPPQSLAQSQVLDCAVDPERVGALLDGRLTGPEREAALVETAASDDDATVFADTAAVLREAEETER